MFTTQTTNTPTANLVNLEFQAETLRRYDEIYRKNDLCTLWNILVDESLVLGNCPTIIGNIITSNVIFGDDGFAIAGVQIKTSSDVQIMFPACAVFDELSATSDVSKASKWVDNNYIGTNITMKEDSTFKLFFRCDDHIVP